MQARYYDPVLGRFMSPDPIGSVDQFNLFAYVGNDPVNKMDPTGLFASSFRSGAFNGGVMPVPMSTSPTAPSPFPSSGTQEVHVTGTASWAISATGSVGIAADSKGNIAVTMTAGVGGGTPGASVELGVTTTNAESVNDLQGASGVTSVGGGEVIVGTAAVIAGAGYTGTTTSIGLGAGTPVSASGHVTVTQVINVTEPPSPPPDQELEK